MSMQFPSHPVQAVSRQSGRVKQVAVILLRVTFSRDDASEVSVVSPVDAAETWRREGKGSLRHELHEVGTELGRATPQLEPEVAIRIDRPPFDIVRLLHFDELIPSGSCCLVG